MKAPWTEGRMPIDEYHADSAVTHSKLSDYRRRGPAYFAGRYVSKTIDRDPPSSAQALGQLVEDHVQQRLEGYAVKPPGMKLSTKEGRAWKEEHGGETIVAPDDWTTAEMCAKSVFGNSIAAELIENATAQAEARGVFQLGPKPFEIQCRPDWAGEGCPASDLRPYSADLKKTRDFNGFLRGYEPRKWAYDLQAAFIDWVLESHDVRPHLHFLIVVEDSSPFRCAVVDITRPARLAAGTVLDQLTSLSGNYAADEWPLVEQELVVLEVV